MYCKMDQILLVCAQRGEGTGLLVLCACASVLSKKALSPRPITTSVCACAQAPPLPCCMGKRPGKYTGNARGDGMGAPTAQERPRSFGVFVQACWPTMKHSEGMCGARSEQGWKLTSIRTKLFSRASAFHNSVQTACNDPNGLQRANRSSAPTEMEKIIATKVERIRSGVASGRTGWCRDRQQRPDAPSSSAAGERWTQQTTRSLWGPQASSRVAQTYPACIASMCGASVSFQLVALRTPHQRL